MIDATTAGVVLARKQIKPIDSDAFGVAVSALPKPHPGVAHLYDFRPRDARPLTEQERQEHVRKVKEAMIKQRQSNALHRDPVVEEVGGWLRSMLP
jgi:hypothetical protein